MTVGNPQTYPKAGDISALNGGVLRRILIKGIIINRFRGDPSLFADGVKLLEEYARTPVLGVIHYLPQIGVDEEDAVALESARYRWPAPIRKGTSPDVPSTMLRVAIVKLPHIASFTDCDPLLAEPDVEAFFTTNPTALIQAVRYRISFGWPTPIWPT